MMDPIIISFYTFGTPYEEEVKNLIRSCAEFELEIDINGIDSKGSWEKNCAFKPFFIFQKMKKWDRPVFWVDADAVFKQRPNFNDFNDCDVAARLNEFLPKAHASRIISNAIFFRNSPSGLTLLEDWCKATEKEVNEEGRKMEFWDQTTLRDAMHRNGVARFLPMPLKYSKIFDFDDLFISEKEVVIEHYQASRRFKGKINAGANHCCH